MESVGRKLREARTRQGKTLEQVNQQTRIPLRNLQAIEDDDCTIFGSPFFYRSFVKQYADSVGLAPDELAVEVKAVTDSMPVPLVPGEGGYKPPKIKPLVSGGKPRWSRWFASLGSLTLVIVACSAFYAFWRAPASGTPVSLS